MFFSGFYRRLHPCTYSYNTRLHIHKNKINLWMGGEVGRIREVLGEGKLITIYCMEKSIFNLKKEIRLGIRVEFLPDLLGVPYPTMYSLLLLIRHNLELPGRWEPQLNNCLDQNGMWPCLQRIVLKGDWWGRALPTKGSTIPMKVGLSYIRKLPEHEPRFKPVNRVLPWLLLEFLPWLPWWTVTWKCKLK